MSSTSSPQSARSTRLPSEDALAAELEAYVLRTLERDKHAASTTLTPRNIRNYLIARFGLGDEHALDDFRPFIKKMARDVVERRDTGQAPLYLHTNDAPTQASSSGSRSASRTHRRVAHSDEDDGPRREELKSPRRTKAASEPRQRRKRSASVSSSGEDDVSEGTATPDSHSSNMKISSGDESGESASVDRSRFSGRQRKRSASDEGKSGKQRSKRTKTKGRRSKNTQSRLDSLKALCVSCGARKIWATYFRSQGCPGDPTTDSDVEAAQIRCVLELLRSIGAWEGMTAKQAAKLKDERELAKEIAEINADSSGCADPADRPGKRVRKPSALAMASATYKSVVSEAKADLAEAGDSDAQDVMSALEETDDDLDATLPAKRSARRRMVVGQDTDSSDIDFEDAS